MLAHPEWLQALSIQNANAYKEGLGAKWAAIAQYWADPKAHIEAACQKSICSTLAISLWTRRTELVDALDDGPDLGIIAEKNPGT